MVGPQWKPLNKPGGAKVLILGDMMKTGSTVEVVMKGLEQGFQRGNVWLGFLALCDVESPKAGTHFLSPENFKHMGRQKDTYDEWLPRIAFLGFLSPIRPWMPWE